MTTTEPSTESTEPTDESTEQAAQPPVRTDWKAAAEKALAESRKHEARAKANAAAAKELESLRASSMTDLERATQQARDEGRAEALRVANSKLVSAEIRAAAAGRPIDVAALIEGIDPGRFVTDDGDVDTAAITSWLDRIAPAADPASSGPRRVVDFGQGVRGQNVSESPADQFGRILSGLNK